jgi:UDP-N-acetylmuramoyl-tripeptide--D-alanyl-D-alanine ligase
VKALTFGFAQHHGGGSLKGLSERQPLPSISIDTRTLKKGEAFWALQGRKDGQEFIFDAQAHGASAVVVSESWWQKNPEAAQKIQTAWIVPDTLQALQSVAKAWRNELGIPLIAITGSNGKTSTKELIGQALRAKFSVGTTVGNLNNHIGVPLSLLSLRAEHEIAVIEMGANHPGEIGFLCTIALPTDGLITSIARAHLEGFGDIEKVAAAKGELFQYLAKSGRAFVPVSDSRCVRVSEKVKHRIGYGFESQPTDWRDIYYQGKQLRLAEDAHPIFQFLNTEVRLQLSGKFWARAALAALIIADAFGVEPALAVKAVASWQGISGRTQIRRLHDMTFIDDTYNANPDSMRSALELLRDLSGQRHIAVLGDMGELGLHAEEEHRLLGREIAGMRLNKLYCLGQLSGLMAEEARNAGTDVWHTEKPEELIDRLRKDLARGDTVLFKASRSMALDGVINALMA